MRRDDGRRKTASPSAQPVRGTNPQFLVDKIVRDRVCACPYWKDACFGLNEASLVDRAVGLECVGGTYGGGRRPTRFLCLLLKMLQMQPSAAIVRELLRNADHKYVRALAALYVRLTAASRDVYAELEPLYSDFRKLRVRSEDGRFAIVHMDEFVARLLRSGGGIECSVQLPQLLPRWTLEAEGSLDRRPSPLMDEYVARMQRSAAAAEPPPKPDPQTALRSDGGGALSVEETNRLRAALGLRPLAP